MPLKVKKELNAIKQYYVNQEQVKKLQRRLEKHRATTKNKLIKKATSNNNYKATQEWFLAPT